VREYLFQSMGPETPAEGDASTLVDDDLENARVVMEEQVAYAHLLAKYLDDPERASVSRQEIKQMVRQMVKDPGVRHEAAVASGVYELLKEHSNA
jgi:hypothetical protein